MCCFLPHCLCAPADEFGSLVKSISCVSCPFPVCSTPEVSHLPANLSLPSAGEREQYAGVPEEEALLIPTWWMCLCHHLWAGTVPSAQWVGYCALCLAGQQLWHGHSVLPSLSDFSPILCSTLSPFPPGSCLHTTYFVVGRSC